MAQSGATPQAMVDQTPKYDKRFKGRRPNQIVGKSGIIRRDKRSARKKYL